LLFAFFSILVLNVVLALKYQIDNVTNFLQFACDFVLMEGLQGDNTDETLAEPMRKKIIRDISSRGCSLAQVEELALLHLLDLLVGEMVLRQVPLVVLLYIEGAQGVVWCVGGGWCAQPRVRVSLDGI
jgi:hypothetical protein